MAFTEKNQRYRFQIEQEDGTLIEGGAESKGLCLDHLLHCLYHSLLIEQTKNPKATKPGIRCWYLGSGSCLKKEITL